jgi:hypothetical protein
MKANYKIAAAVICRFVLGAGTVQMLHAMVAARLGPEHAGK